MDGKCLQCATSDGNIVVTIAPALIIVLLASAVVYMFCRNRKAEIEQLLSGELSKDALEERTSQAFEKSRRRLRASQTSENDDANDATDAGSAGIAGMKVRAKIFLSLIQVLTQMGAVFEIAFPPMFTSVLKWAGILQLDLLSAVPLDCIFRSNFHRALLLRTLVPLALMIFVGVWGWWLLRKARATSRKGASRVWLGNLLMNLNLLILFAVYPSVSSHIFATFACNKLDDGSSWLHADLSIDCSSAEHTTMVIYAAVMIFVYPLGAPALYAFLLFGRHVSTLRRLAAIEAQCTALSKLAASDEELARLNPARNELSTWRKEVEPQLEKLEAEKIAVNATLPDYIQTLAGNAYALNVFYFEIIECLRKLSLVCVPVFLPAGSSGQLLFGLIICFLTYGVYSALRPYSGPFDNSFANLAQVLIFFTILSSIALSTASPTDITTKVVDVLLTALFFAPIVYEIVIDAGSMLRCNPLRGTKGSVAASVE